MAARAYWKGYLKLSLVTCPVALYPASSKSQKTRFHQINKKTGHRLRQQMVDEETGRAVDGENKGRGYELTKGKFVQIEPEEIEAIEFENTHTIEIDKFVPEEEIDKRYYERPYYIVPDGKSGEEAFGVIRDAMKDKGRVALAGIIFANRQHILAIEPWGKGMLGTTLRFDYEVRDEKEFFKGIGSHRVPKETGGTEVFGLFLDLGFDAFHLSRAGKVRIPDGRPAFPQVPPCTPEEVLAEHGLTAGPARVLDAGAEATLVTWQR